MVDCGSVCGVLLCCFSFDSLLNVHAVLYSFHYTAIRISLVFRFLTSSSLVAAHGALYDQMTRPARPKTIFGFWCWACIFPTLFVVSGFCQRGHHELDCQRLDSIMIVAGGSQLTKARGAIRDQDRVISR